MRMLRKLNKHQLEMVQKAINCYCVEKELNLEFFSNISESILEGCFGKIKLFFAIRSDRVYLSVLVGYLPEGLMNYIKSNTFGVINQ